MEVPLVHSFPPIADRSAQTLILGSMPGAASLAANRYYAHPQNAFWRIMAALLQFDLNISYSRKTKTLKTARIAIWDVLQSCEREGSLDSSIARATQVPNDFADFFRRHPAIRRVYFNGSMAQACFRRHATLPALVTSTRLPSTSPAHAARSFEDKLQAWRVVAN